MQPKLARQILFVAFAALLLLLAGCFQSAGTNPESLSVVDTGPTFTPLPPQVVTQEIVVTATVDPNVPTVDVGFLFQTPVVTIDPGQGGAVGGPLDPLDITATFIVQNATNEAALALTQDALATLGFPTETPTLSLIATTPAGPIVSGADCIHEVQSTDRNVYRISLLYGVSVDDIARATPLTNPNLIYIGDKLVIPGCGTTGYRPPPTTVPSSSGSPVTGGSTYTVQQGDTLFRISLQTGIPMASIAAANGIDNWNLIVVGRTLTIPAS
jgi:LysM repeat protein